MSAPANLLASDQSAVGAARLTPLSPSPPLPSNEYKVGNKVKLSVVRTGSVSSKNKRQPNEQYVSPKNIAALRGSTVEIWCIYGGT